MQKYFGGFPETCYICLLFVSLSQPAICFTHEGASIDCINDKLSDVHICLYKRKLSDNSNVLYIKKFDYI